RIVSRQELCRHRSGGARSQRGDARRIHHGRRCTVTCVCEHDGALDGRQRKPLRVVREVTVNLRRETALDTAQPGCLDVEAAVLRRHPQHTRPERAPSGVEPKRALNRLDTVIKGQEFDDVSTRKEKHDGYLFFRVVAYSPSKRAIPCASTWWSFSETARSARIATSMPCDSS